jgi:hypothetical protein
MPRPKLANLQAGRVIEQRAYHRAADLAKSYAEHWDAEARVTEKVDPDDDWSATIKAGHWRILEKTIRDLARL